MSWTVRRTFTVGFFGTSLSNPGRLNPGWVALMSQELRGVPEAIGPVLVLNQAKGGETSTWGAANVFTLADKRPNAVFSEDFTINDCFDSGGGPQVSQAQQAINMQAIHDALIASNAACEITWMSMSSVDAAVAVGRPALAARYAAGGVKALAMGDRWLDLYAGGNAFPVPPGVAGGWVKPLPTVDTYDGDGLHPKGPNAVDVYLTPAVKFAVRGAMARFYGLAAPTP